jgi:hypothetical protein
VDSRESPRLECYAGRVQITCGLTSTWKLWRRHTHHVGRKQYLPFVQCSFYYGASKRAEKNVWATNCTYQSQCHVAIVRKS